MNFMTPLRVLLFLPALLAISYAGAADEDALGAADRRLFADGLFSRGLHKRAAAEYEALARDYPGVEELDTVLFRWAESARLCGEPENASRILLRLAKEFPDSPYRHRAIFQRGAIALEGDHFEIAAELLELLLRENIPPELRESALYFRAEALSQLSLKKDAESLYTAFLKDFPESALADYARLSLGRILSDNNTPADVERARDLFKETAASPATPRLGAEALYLLAQCEFAREQYKLSSDAFFELARRFPDDERTLAVRLQSTWAAYRAGLYAETLDLADQALKKQALEQKDEWLYLKGASEYQLSRYPEVIRTFADLDKEFSGSRYAGAAAYQTAVAHQRLGETLLATEAAMLVPVEDPLREEALWLLGDCFASLEDSDRAIQYYRLFADEFPDSQRTPDALYRLAHQLHQRESWSDAAAAYLSLADKAPAHELAPRSLFASGYCRMRAGRSAEAIRDWDRLLRSAPQDETAIEARFRKGIEEIRVGRLDDAGDTLEVFLQQHPDSTHALEARFWQATLLQRKGDPHEAEKNLRLVLAASPTRELEREAVFLMALIAQETDRPDEAADGFQSLLDTPVCKRLTATQLGWLAEHQYQRDAFAKAEQAARKLVEQAPDNSWKQAAWTLTGRAARAGGNSDAAEKAFQNAVDVPGKTRYVAEAHLRLGEIRLDTGRIEDAEASFRRASSLAATPELQSIRILSHAGLGKALLRKDDKEAAARYLLGVCLLNRDSKHLPPIMEKTIRLLEELSQHEEADTLRKDLMELYPASEEAARATSAEKAVQR